MEKINVNRFWIQAPMQVCLDKSVLILHVNHKPQWDVDSLSLKDTNLPFRYVVTHGHEERTFCDYCRTSHSETVPVSNEYIHEWFANKPEIRIRLHLFSCFTHLLSLGIGANSVRAGSWSLLAITILYRPYRLFWWSLFSSVQVFQTSAFHKYYQVLVIISERHLPKRESQNDE